MNKSFQPQSHYSENSMNNYILLQLRLFFDFQFRTLFFDLKRELSKAEGKILDVGCGNSPFKHLVKKGTEYIGLDYENSSQFNYTRTDVVYYDGKKIPFDDNSFENLICTEVLEHIPDPQEFIAEIYRVLKPKGKAIFTIPWSARNHFIPNDFYRYTPITLEKLFNCFSKVSIKSRGTDVTTIAAKCIVFYLSLAINVRSRESAYIIHILKSLANIFFLILLVPFMIKIVLIGHLSLLLKIGSSDDCLGFTVLLEK